MNVLKINREFQLHGKGFGHANEEESKRQLWVTAFGTIKQHVILFLSAAEVFLENDEKITLITKEKFLEHIF